MSVQQLPHDIGTLPREVRDAACDLLRRNLEPASRDLRAKGSTSTAKGRRATIRFANRICTFIERPAIRAEFSNFESFARHFGRAPTAPPPLPVVGPCQIG